MDEENNCVLPEMPSSVSNSLNGQKSSVPRTNTNSVSRPTARKTLRRNSSLIGNSSSVTGQQNQHYRKSTNSLTASALHSSQNLVPPVKHLNNSTIYVDDENKPRGKVL